MILRYFILSLNYYKLLLVRCKLLAELIEFFSYLCSKFHHHRYLGSDVVTVNSLDTCLRSNFVRLLSSGVNERCSHCLEHALHFVHVISKHFVLQLHVGGNGSLQVVGMGQNVGLHPLKLSVHLVPTSQ